MADGLETAANTPPPQFIFTARNDPAAWPLPKAASNKLIQLHQRARDMHVQIPEFEDILELTNAKLAHERRIHDLTKPRGEGGFSLDPSSPQVRDEQQKLARVVAERTRLEKLREVRSARWNAAGQLERAVTDWLSSGIPGNCELVAVEDVAPAKLLAKGETTAAAVARYRRQLSDLAGKLQQVRAAPYPLKLAIQKATAQIEALATPPDCKSIIDRLQPIGFASTTLTSTVRGLDTPALAFCETINTPGLFVWLFERELIAKVTAGIKQSARDGEALDEQQRAAQETTLLEQMMDFEQKECALIWDLESRGEIEDFRRDTTAAALLGVRTVVVAPRAAPSGTSPEHVREIVGPR
jgi:hypothetical protein